MMIKTATALAHPNIALIKYWGNRDHSLRLPSNGSISITLGFLETKTTATFDPSMKEDKLFLNGTPISGPPFERVRSHIDIIRKMAGISLRGEITSQSNFPLGAGIASSASGFAALTVSASAAAGLEVSPSELSRIARLGSGSACRSIFGGYVEWKAGLEDSDSFAKPIADQDHWDLVDIIAIIEEGHKSIGSTSGHKLAETSPLQKPRIEDAERRLRICKQAILDQDFPSLASIVEEDSNMMHAVMMTSHPQLLYWKPETILIMQSVIEWRDAGMDVCYTIDAGPNVHCLCRSEFEDEIHNLLTQIPGVLRVIHSPAGGPARLIG